MPTQRTRDRNPNRFKEPYYLKNLLTAGARASSLGVAVLDSQTRFCAVNAWLAREMQAPENHLGRTTREVVGNVAIPMEAVHEKVLTLGKADSLVVAGSVRDKPEFGYWLNHCFPIFGDSRRVEQLGLFVVNVTAEKATLAIFDALATDSKRLMAKAAGLLDKYDESIKHYHWFLKQSFNELACSFSEWKVDQFRSRIMSLDNEISIMRELIYTVQAHFSIPEC